MASTSRKLPRSRVATAGALVGALMLSAGLVAFTQSKAQALIDCQPHTNTADELQLLSIVSAWRVEYVPGVDPTHPLVVSDPLNAAAAGYAQYLADHSTATGHTADGQTVGQRAVQCGYPESIAFGDDTVAVVHNEAGASLTAQQAFDQMAAESYYQSHMRVPVQLGLPSALPLRCVGVGGAVSEDGKGAAFVVMFMGADDACPQSVHQTTPSPEPSFPGYITKTPTPTPTSTPTKTATPTATPTPDGRHARVAQVAVNAPEAVPQP